MGEIVTAQAADGTIRTTSTDAVKDSETSEPKPKGRKRSPITSKNAEGVEVDRRGVVKTQWDNPDADPNLRKHVGESPDGEGNEIS